MDDSAKYDNCNPVILEYLLAGVESEETRILDVGCWRGALGRQLMKRVKIKIDGLDNNKEMAHAKVAGYSKLYNIDLNASLNLAIIDESYDFIVFGDVLEHTISPENVLTLLSTKLKMGGQVIISLPNIGFALNRVAHLFGHWTYSEKGIMDRTHLRFFTKRSMKQFITGEDFEILKQEGLSEVRGGFFFLRPLAKLFPSLFAMQIIFLARPRSSST